MHVDGRVLLDDCHWRGFAVERDGELERAAARQCVLFVVGAVAVADNFDQGPARIQRHGEGLSGRLYAHDCVAHQHARAGHVGVDREHGDTILQQSQARLEAGRPGDLVARGLCPKARQPA